MEVQAGPMQTPHADHGVELGADGGHEAAADVVGVPTAALIRIALVFAVVVVVLVYEFIISIAVLLVVRPCPCFGCLVHIFVDYWCHPSIEFFSFPTTMLLS
jgi:hypothetical protein